MRCKEKIKIMKKNQKQYSGPIDELRNTKLMKGNRARLPTFKEIADKTGVSEGTVLAYNHGRAWNYSWVRRLVKTYKSNGVSWLYVERLYLKYEPLFEARSRLKS